MMKDSRTLDSVDVRDMGRSLSSEGMGITLGSGTTVASFHCVGTTPERREVFRILVSGVLSSKANSWTILFGNWSGPGDVLTLILDSSRHIWDLVIVGAGPAGR